MSKKRRWQKRLRAIERGDRERQLRRRVKGVPFGFARALDKDKRP